MQCQKSFTIVVNAIPCDNIGDATWVLSINDPHPGSVMTMAGGDGGFEFHLVGAPNAGANYAITSSVLACPRVPEYSAVMEIDYDLFLQEFGAGSGASLNIIGRRGATGIIFYSNAAPNNSSVSDSGTLSSAPLSMFFDESYTFQVQVIISCTGGGIADLTGTVRIRPLVPP